MIHQFCERPLNIHAIVNDREIGFTDCLVVAINGVQRRNIYLRIIPPSSDPPLQS
jgi:hypothetical protein